MQMKMIQGNINAKYCLSAKVDLANNGDDGHVADDAVDNDAAVDNAGVGGGDQTEPMLDLSPTEDCLLEM